MVGYYASIFLLGHHPVLFFLRDGLLVQILCALGFLAHLKEACSGFVTDVFVELLLWNDLPENKFTLGAIPPENPVIFNLAEAFELLVIPECLLFTSGPGDPLIPAFRGQAQDALERQVRP